MSDRNLQERIEVCRERFSAAPQSRAFAPLADLLREAGQHEEALALLEEGLVSHPDFHGAMVILGRTLLDAGRTGHALRVLARVLEHDKENLVALRLLADEALGRGAAGEVRGWLEQLVSLEPDVPRWTEGLAAAAAAEATRPVAGGSSGADRPVPSAEDQDAFATMTLVDIYVAQGYHARALEALERINRRDPDREDVRQRIAEITRAAAEAEARQNSGGNGTGATPRPAAERAARRAREKAHFSEWLDRVNGEGGQAP